MLALTSSSDDMLPSYFKSSEGILRICALLFGIITLGMSAYSHFNSHWSSHTRLQKGVGKNLHLVLQNDYEECVQSRRSFSRRAPIRRGLFDREEYHGGLMIHCPKPSAEFFLVSASPLIVIISLISIVVAGIVKPATLKGQLKPFDIIIQISSAVCFLLGGSLYIYSAYFISDWCSVNAKDPLIRYTVGVDPKLESQFQIGNNLILRQVVEDGRSYTGGDKEVIQGTNVNLADVETDPKDDFADEMVMHGAELCNIQELTEEKYWTGVLAIITALIYAATLFFIMKSSRGTPPQPSNNRRVLRVSGEEGRLSFDKAVGPASNNRGSNFPDYIIQ